MGGGGGLPEKIQLKDLFSLLVLDFLSRSYPFQTIQADS